jgi:hypothetical protein
LLLLIKYKAIKWCHFVGGEASNTLIPESACKNQHHHFCSRGLLFFFIPFNSIKRGDSSSASG